MSLLFTCCGSLTREMPAHPLRFIQFERTGVSLLLSDTNLRQDVKDRLALDFQFSRQIVNSNLTHPPTCFSDFPLSVHCYPHGIFLAFSTQWSALSPEALSLPEIPGASLLQVFWLAGLFRLRLLGSNDLFGLRLRILAVHVHFRNICRRRVLDAGNG